MTDWQEAFERAGYRRYPASRLDLSDALYQRRLFLAEDKDDDVFLNFAHYAPASEVMRDHDAFTGWVQVESPNGWCVRIETFTHVGRDIVTRLPEIEAGLIALVDAALQPLNPGPTGRATHTIHNARSGEK